jgi:hypothetical protein
MNLFYKRGVSIHLIITEGLIIARYIFVVLSNDNINKPEFLCLLAVKVKSFHTCHDIFYKNNFNTTFWSITKEQKIKGVRTRHI